MNWLLIIEFWCIYAFIQTLAWRLRQWRDAKITLSKGDKL